MTRSESTSELQIQEGISHILWANLSQTGLTEEIIRVSDVKILTLPQDQHEGAFLNTIAFDFSVGEHDDPSVFIQPLMTATSGPLLNRQMFGLKLYLLSDDAEEQQRYAQQIWAGVTSEDQQALARVALEYLIHREEGTVTNPSPKMPDYFRIKAQANLNYLTLVTAALKQGNCNFSITPSTASLKVSLK